MKAFIVGIHWVLLCCFVVSYAQQESDFLQADSSVVQPDSTFSKNVPTDSNALSQADTLAIVDSTATLLDTNIIIPQLEFVGVGLADALKSLVRAYELSAYIDTSVTGNITLRLDNVSLNDALLFIIREYGLAWEKVGGIIKIYKPEQPPPPPPEVEMSIKSGLLTCDLNNVSLQRFVDALTDSAGINIIIDGGASGAISGRLKDVPVEKALGILLTSNGFTLRIADSICYIGLGETTGKGGRRTSRFSINCENQLVTLSVSHAPLGDILSTIGDNCGVSLFIRGTLEGSVSANFADMPIEDALASLLQDTPYTYKKDNDMYFIGSRTSEDMYVSELILLQHLVASTVESLIPATLAKQVSLKVVVEHNGLVAVGPKTAINEIKKFMKTIDIPPAMVLFDVLVVDYSTTDIFQLEIMANNTGEASKSTQTYYPFVDISETGKGLNDELDWLGARLGISKIGPLSDDFFARLQILSQEGKANIRSRPKIASLCGHTASINVGTTQYYLLETETVVPSQGTVTTQTSQRFETIQADMKIEVTPYVNESGELIVDIKPEFSTPVSALSSEVPPTINHRVLQSTVRLKNGETVILGGLVQNHEVSTKKKFPLLGSLPLLGPLFQNVDRSNIKTELMIYITPHVYYGSEGKVEINSILKGK